MDNAMILRGKKEVVGLRDLEWLGDELVRKFRRRIEWPILLCRLSERELNRFDRSEWGW